MISRRIFAFSIPSVSSFANVLAVLPVVAAGFVGTHLSAASVLIDDFSAGTNFTLAISPFVRTDNNYVGAGPIGGGRQIAMSSVFGANTSSLNTTAGTFSTSITGYSDSFLFWGSYDSNNPVALNLTGAQSFDVEFTAFSLGQGDAGGGNDGIFLQFLDNVGSYHSFAASGATISSLAANNGGILSVAVSSFSGAAYTGPIQGLTLYFDDRDLSATVTKVSVTTSSAVPDTAGTVPLILMGLVGMAFAKRRLNRNAR